jgi:hypothetical protein
VTQIVIRNGNSARAEAFLGMLPRDKTWRVDVNELRPRRSPDQNNYLWGVVYRTVLDTGLREAGWTGDDVHEYFLGEHFGWETIEGLGRKRLRPLRRSSKLNKQEFTDYIAFIQRTMAERGVYVPDPNEDVT